MSNTLKTQSEIELVREFGRLLARVFKMYTFNNTSVEAKQLVKTTYDAMWKGINVVKPRTRLGDVGYVLQKRAEQAS